jgi:hypothetical protein
MLAARDKVRICSQARIVGVVFWIGPTRSPAGNTVSVLANRATLASRPNAITEAKPELVTVTPQAFHQPLCALTFGGVSLFVYLPT